MNQGTFSDYHYIYSSNILAIGSRWAAIINGREFGIFHDYVTSAAVAVGDYGSRLSWFSTLTTIIMNVLDQVPIIVMIENQFF